MHNAQDEIIYVGKARILKNRVRQYFQSSYNKSVKIQHMVSHIAYFEYIITDSELEALVLENNLIKEHHPKYNTKLKDDKGYPYIKVTVNEEFPRIMLARKMKADGGKYFGPYTSAGAVNDTIELLRKIFKIRTCNRRLPKDTGKDRPCLYYQIKQCDAPCQGYISKEEYAKQIEETIKFLNGNYKQVAKMLQEKMQKASDELEFEQAMEYRDLLKSIERIMDRQKINTYAFEDRDIIAMAQDDKDVVVSIFFIRQGKLLGREHFHMEADEESSKEEVLGAFVKQFYAGTPYLPGEIFLEHDISEKEIIEELKRAVQEKQKEKKTCILSFDLYPGVRKEEMMELANALQPDRIFDIEDCAKDEETLLREFKDYITDDRVFGIMCHKTIDTWFESEKLETVKKAIETERAEEKDTNGGLIVIVGTAAELLTEADLLVYCDLTRWEVQLRYRSGMPNWHSTNYNDPILTKYKRGFFIEWRLADRYKKERYEKFTYLLDTEKENAPVLTTGNAFRGALQQLARQPFRMEPYFDPGVWGGQWMKENFGLDASKENFAWSFDGVPEENSLNLEIGGKVLKVPAQDLVFYAPHELLGERVHGRFGAEFPIRFDLLDTMGGQNLSLQVHPLTEYIYEKFGMPYTQDESYYLLDADEDEETYVYLGLKEGVDKKEMGRELRAAEKGEELFPAEKYVNKIPVKKHDHVLIPAGTVHCSGKNTMVLEISATPYIFTFKLWDWGRLGMDGLPRPIHLDHGMKNIQWNRDTKWVYDNIVGQQKILEKTETCEVERTGLHSREFIDTIRYTLSGPHTVSMDDTVHVMNLVEGRSARIESMDGSFAPFTVHYAETAIVPAAVGTYRIVPEEGEMIKMLVASVG